jgi:GLPGLI family protein
MKKTITVLAVILTSFTLKAQNVEHTHGKIEFAKKVNELAFVKQVYSSAQDQANVDQYAKNNPQFQDYTFQLVFDSETSVYLPIASAPRKRAVSEVGRNTIVYTDFKKESYISQRKIFNNVFLLEGPLKKIKWKITTETRNIAGHDCHRANGLTSDSTYVVAFYTDDIPLKGGPELFNGLPGMILGIALPDDHVTWFATKVDFIQPEEGLIVAPKVGQTATMQSLLTQLDIDLSSYGPIKPFLLKNVSY